MYVVLRAMDFYHFLKSLNFFVRHYQFAFKPPIIITNVHISSPRNQWQIFTKKNIIIFGFFVFEFLFLFFNFHAKPYICSFTSFNLRADSKIKVMVDERWKRKLRSEEFQFSNLNYFSAEICLKIGLFSQWVTSNFFSKYKHVKCNSSSGFTTQSLRFINGLLSL